MCPLASITTRNFLSYPLHRSIFICRGGGGETLLLWPLASEEVSRPFFNEIQACQDPQTIGWLGTRVLHLRGKGPISD